MSAFTDCNLWKRAGLPCQLSTEPHCQHPALRGPGAERPPWWRGSTGRGRHRELFWAAGRTSPAYSDSCGHRTRSVRKKFAPLFLQAGGEAAAAPTRGPATTRRRRRPASLRRARGHLRYWLPVLGGGACAGRGGRRHGLFLPPGLDPGEGLRPASRTDCLFPVVPHSAAGEARSRWVLRCRVLCPSPTWVCRRGSCRGGAGPGPGGAALKWGGRREGLAAGPSCSLAGRGVSSSLFTSHRSTRSSDGSAPLRSESELQCSWSTPRSQSRCSRRSHISAVTAPARQRWCCVLSGFELGKLLRCFWFPPHSVVSPSLSAASPSGICSLKDWKPVVLTAKSSVLMRSSAMLLMKYIHHILLYSIFSALGAPEVIRERCGC